MNAMLALYRLLLLLQPREIRRRYGAEMLQLVRDRAVEGASPSFWMREYADVLASTARAHRPSVGWLLVGSAVAHSAYAALVHPASTMGIAAVLLTATALLGGATLVARRRPA